MLPYIHTINTQPCFEFTSQLWKPGMMGGVVLLVLLLVVLVLVLWKVGAGG
jgi:hypothetical protein